MRVFMTGATGFIGRAVALRLLRDGHEVHALCRSEPKARQALGAEVRLVGLGDDDRGLPAALAGCDAIVHLAGEPVVGRRWTAAYRRALVTSRVALTQRLVAAVGALPPEERPRTLVSASAVGFYGPERGDEVLDEESDGGTGFLADLCRDWEAATFGARAHGLRVAALRIGIVLGREGGALAKMVPAFRLGLGGPLGHGRQYLPWIHLEDVVELCVVAVDDHRYEGVLNATAPEPATSRDFAKSLGRALRRPAALATPAPVLRLLFGAAASAVLAGQRALPARALALGFRFRFPTLAPALADLVSDDASVSITRVMEALPAGDYLRSRPARYLLTQETLLDAPLREVFPFFASAQNLNCMTPPTLTLDIKTRLPIELRPGAVIDYALRIGPIPMGWRTVIEEWQPGERFIDAQHHGPYRAWWHEHHFTAVGERTRMEDRVYYAPPLGVLGRLANQLFIAPMLRRIFSYRACAIRFRFGGEAGTTRRDAA